MTRHLAPEHGFLHGLFEFSLLAKSVFAGIEALTGASLLLAPNPALHRAIDWLTQRELIEDPTDPLLSRLMAALSHFDAGSQHFYAVYLLGHGLLKLVVLAMLARRIAFAYPLAIVVFSGFIVYQLHRWQLTGSPAMLALSALDLAVIALTWHEWRNSPSTLARKR